MYSVSLGNGYSFIILECWTISIGDIENHVDMSMKSCQLMTPIFFFFFFQWCSLNQVTLSASFEKSQQFWPLF